MRLVKDADSAALVSRACGMLPVMVVVIRADAGDGRDDLVDDVVMPPDARRRPSGGKVSIGAITVQAAQDAPSATRLWPGPVISMMLVMVARSMPMMPRCWSL